MVYNKNILSAYFAGQFNSWGLIHPCLVQMTRVLAPSAGSSTVEGWEEAASGVTLVIVESPAKAKTIQKFLDDNRYIVDFCAGHVRDLSKAKDAPLELRKETVQKDLALNAASLGVRVHSGFEPIYVNMKGKAEVIGRLKRKANQCSRILLATDEDREGEAISWHLVEVLQVSVLRNTRVHNLIQCNLKSKMIPLSVHYVAEYPHQASRIQRNYEGGDHPVF